MNIMRKESAPDKFDLYILNVDEFKALNQQKNELKEKIAELQLQFEESIRPYETELNTIIKKLESNLSRMEGSPVAKPATAKFGRGKLGISIKNLLQANPDKAFKPREIAAALQTKGTAVSLWFNKYGNQDPEIERIPVGEGGKRFIYQIKK
ncbi:hypothetical protein FGF66_06100 [Chlorobaculum thiosulfatiphilum]|jgi:hypothetical protein|uniref:Uncharacterized protein n=1 Tax=Chlorobaculum thiosulfatiphilum TaxID=115852 RepID=A0A5C4S6I5_CHLTI|nr:hypothetical protein [Chlorobaculum thiosulfatiphilum]NTV82438.1 hypothetical protein [Chlorobaculum sp.]TNJ39133.1 hypothetical protein FGF66_06100 [Chlorobaculum thiosulfatiphilum]